MTESAVGDLIRRTRHAFIGSAGRTILRLAALIGALVILGLKGLQCTLNHWGNNSLTMWGYFKVATSALWFGFYRSCLLLWDSIAHYATLDLWHNWGDLLVLVLFFLFCFGALYSMVAIIADWVDGKAEDVAPWYLKMIITAGLLILVSGFLYVVTEKPSGDYELDMSLLLSAQEREYCMVSPEVPFFRTTLDANQTNLINLTQNMTQIINDSKDTSSQLIDLLGGGTQT